MEKEHISTIETNRLRAPVGIGQANGTESQPLQGRGKKWRPNKRQVLIGVLLVGVGLQLARRNHDFLLGEQAPPSVKSDVRSFIVAQPSLPGAVRSATPAKGGGASEHMVAEIA